MERTERVKALREAGRVERMHTMLHHSTYSVGQHSYDAANLLLCLHPNPSFALIKATLWHDCAERWIGDTPSPSKWASPELSENLETMEKGVLAALGCDQPLTAQEAMWLNAIDKLELWLWAHEQLRMGNKNAHAVINNMLMYFEVLRTSDQLPSECEHFLRTYNHERNDDTIPGVI